MPSEKEVRMGDALDLGALVTATPSGLIWKSSKTANATVDSSGVVTPVAVGDTVITATSAVDSSVSASCTVTILKAQLSASDVITAADLAATNTTYTDFSNVSKSSKAKYAGNNAKDSSGNIQLRTNNSNAGIITTRSGGRRLKSVAITFDDSTNSARVLDVYASNAAYTGSDASALYSTETQGTKVVSFAKSSGLSFNYTFESDYKYIGIRSKDGALYLSNVTIVWEQYDAEDIASEIYTMAGGWDNDVSTNDCGNHYKIAKEMVLTLSDEQLNTFKTSADENIASARATYEHWCSVNGDANGYSGAIVSSAKTLPLHFNGSNDNLIPVISVIAGAGLVSVAGFAFLRRKKEDR